MAKNPKVTMPPMKAAHVNMMTDTVIANLSPSGLRHVLRGMLGEDATLTPKFHSLTLKYLSNTIPKSGEILFTRVNGISAPTPAFQALQSRYRCLMGCGHGCESMEALSEVIEQVEVLKGNKSALEVTSLLDVLALVDGDIVQSVTVVQKELITTSRLGKMDATDLQEVARLQNVLDTYRKKCLSDNQAYPFERGLSRLENLIGRPNPSVIRSNKDPVASNRSISPKIRIETTKLGYFEVPRLFMGLWQFSSPAWGTASKSKIDLHFRKHVNAGLIAYDMADHYGDAEVLFGQFRNFQPDAEKLYCATKWAVFQPIDISPEVIDTNIKERLIALSTDKIELLQFHWQDYNDPQYVEACQLIAHHPSVKNLGLCNFDTKRMEEIVESGVSIVSNQVQFSLIDCRPIFAMGRSCTKHKIKLLTYGSLCGGFLADKWIGKPAPNLFDEQMTPSHRKYFEMIAIWGGWDLFQELLNVLKGIGEKYKVTASGVAVRWVLDHEYVAAVIIGARMGISEHTEENLKVFSFVLSENDKLLIDGVLRKSRAKYVFEVMGDCGSEYR